VATYKELMARKQELDSQIENARRAEAASALAGIKETIAAFGFTPDEVFGAPRKPKAVGAARNPTTSDTWSGRGPRPRWLKDQDLEPFRIQG
jgi:DNA-binding protein H-NS